MSIEKEMVRIACKALDDKKAKDIKIIDIHEVSVIADYFVIATGNSNSQVSALVENVEEQMHKNGFAMKQREGNGNSPWILLDYADVIVHVFDKETRNSSWVLMDYGDMIIHIFDEENRLFYDLERIWRDGKILDAQEFLAEGEE